MGSGMLQILHLMLPDGQSKDNTETDTWCHGLQIPAMTPYGPMWPSMLPCAVRTTPS